MRSHTKRSPKSRIRKGALTKAQENTAAPLSSKGANHYSRLATGLCYLSNISYCTWPDSHAPANRTQPHLTESTLSFSAGCSPGPRYYSEKPYGSSTSTQMLSFKKFSLITPIKSEMHRSKALCKLLTCYINIDYMHFAYPTTHYFHTILNCYQNSILTHTTPCETIYHISKARASDIYKPSLPPQCSAVL